MENALDNTLKEDLAHLVHLANIEVARNYASLEINAEITKMVIVNFHMKKVSNSKYPTPQEADNIQAVPLAYAMTSEIKVLAQDKTVNLSMYTRKSQLN